MEKTILPASRQGMDGAVFLLPPSDTSWWNNAVIAFMKDKAFLHCAPANIFLELLSPQYSGPCATLDLHFD